MPTRRLRGNHSTLAASVLGLTLAAPTFLAAQSITECAPPGLYAFAAGPDGNLWFTEPSGNGIGRVNPKGAALCTPDAHTLCLNGGRFAVTAAFQQTQGGPTIEANAVPLTDATGYFWFFDASNVEIIAKLLNGCGTNGYYWFFAAGLTNVGATILVQDLESNMMKSYPNAIGTPFPPIQDTSAFHTCP